LLIDELIRKIDNGFCKFYSYETTISVQEEIIKRLSKKSIRITKITNETELLNSKLRNPGIVIIQNADEILNRLKDYSHLKELYSREIVLLIFLNCEIEDLNQRITWYNFTEKSPLLKPETFAGLPLTNHNVDISKKVNGNSIEESEELADSFMKSVLICSKSVIDHFYNWIRKNKEWLFSGVGHKVIFLIVLMLIFFFGGESCGILSSLK
jgi:hypothetical protein